jgi:DNA-directed RNA polymerase subunit RPC12/RpoP/very-short-patch-repair endonuclease
MCPRKNLLEQFPNFAAEWDQKKNGKLSTDQMTPGSNKEIFWICPNGHSWSASPKERTHKRSPKICPICRSLGYNFPEIASEFHRKRNAELTPEMISKSSSKKVWWKCKKCGHEYEAQVYNRTASGSGCPSCAGRVVGDGNRLSVKNPELIQEWSGRNAPLKPSDFSYGSDKKVWWKCTKCQYEYKASISKRAISGRGCPNCGGKVVNDENRFSTLFPGLINEIHPTKNGNFDPSKVSYGSNQEVWWVCNRRHEWKAPIGRRTSKNSGCPDCTAQTSKPEIRIRTELDALFGSVRHRQRIEGVEIDIYLPEVGVGIEYDGFYWHKGRVKEDKKKNTFLKARKVVLIRVREMPLEKIAAQDIQIESDADNFGMMERVVRSLLKVAKWNEKTLAQIDRYLEKKIFLANDEYKKFVSFLPGPLPEDSLLAKFPVLSKEWDYEENDPLSPEMFHPFSMYRAHWVCSIDKRHKWSSTIANRTTGSGCPFCTSKQFLREQSLGALFPEVSKELVGDVDPYDISVGSKKN